MNILTLFSTGKPRSERDRDTSFRMASTGGHYSSIETSKLFFIILVIILTSAVHHHHCQQSTPQENDSNSSTTSKVPVETSKQDNRDYSEEKNSTDNNKGTILLSASEFVDFTEAPTLLFDGTSNESNDSSTSPPITESSLIATSLSPSTVAAAAAATTTTTFKPITTSKEGEATTPGVAATDDGDVETNDENVDGEQPSAKEPFEPPQNVSQYMDYIETLFHDLRHQISDLFEPHLPQLIRSSQMVQLSGSCSYDMLRMALALRQFEPWALRMIDSSGKVPEGIFEGSFTALGSYDECLNTIFGQQESATTTANNSSQTQGKYCLVNVSPYLPPKPPADRVERMFQEEANRRNYTKDNQFSRLSPMFYYMKFRIGICIPSTCTESDMDSLSEALSSSLRLNITIPNCRIRQYQPITNHQLAAGLVFGSVLALVFGATLMDYSRRKFDRQKRQVVMSMVVTTTANSRHSHYAIPSGEKMSPTCIGYNGGNDYDNDRDKEVYGEFSQRRFFTRLSKNWSWLSFSLLTNYRLHFSPLSSSDRRVQQATSSVRSGSVDQKNSNNNAQMMIRCLNGIRVISLCWVIVANSYITLDPRATKRLTKTREAPKDFLFQMVAQASLAIETFFFLSGVLLSLSFARKLQPNTSRQSRDSGERTQDSASPGCCKSWSTDKPDGDLQRKTKKMDDEDHRSLIRLRWIQFYIHRYVRMTPATMLVIAFTMYAYGYGDGPLWFEATHKAHQSCSQNWWRHLLHVANFIDTRYRKIGYALVTLIGASSIGFIFYTTYMRNLPPTLLFYNSDPESRREFGNTIMTKPLTHALPYLVGMLVGKWLTSSSQQQQQTTGGKSSELNSTHHHNGHISAISGGSLTSLFGGIATVVALAEVFLPYKWNNSHLPTRLLASLYAAFFRFAWSLVLAYIIMCCRHKRGRRCAVIAAARSSVNDQSVSGGGATMANSTSPTTKPPRPPIAGRQQCASCQTLDMIGGATARKGAAVGNHHDDNIIMSLATTASKPPPLMASAHHHHQQQQQQLWCLCGSGGNLVNRLLSLDVFTYLSKLSFVAYLIHLPLMSVFIAQTRGLFAFSHTLVIHLALSYLVMTFLLSFLLVHLIELPFLTFERYLFENLLANHRTGGGGGDDSDSSGSSREPRQSDDDDDSQIGCDNITHATSGYNDIVGPKTFTGAGTSSSYSIDTCSTGTATTMSVVSEKL